MADETPPPVEKPASIHLSGGIRVQRVTETELRWINRAPAQIAILLVTISALIGMVAMVVVIQSGTRAQDRLLGSNKSLQATVDELQRELAVVSQENECRSQFSIVVQAALGHSASVTDRGLAVILRRDTLDQTALAQALEDASQRLDEAVSSRARTEAVCANKTGEHP